MCLDSKFLHILVNLILITLYISIFVHISMYSSPPLPHNKKKSRYKTQHFTMDSLFLETLYFLVGQILLCSFLILVLLTIAGLLSSVVDSGQDWEASWEKERGPRVNLGFVIICFMSFNSILSSVN